MTDNELVRRAKRGDLEAFESIVKKYETRVAATVIGMLGACQAADDVGQEVFIRFYKYIDKFREDASLATYLTRIAINLSLNEINRRKRRRFFFRDQDEVDTEVPTTNLNDDIQMMENRELVRAAIEKLNPTFRTVLVLRLIEGYSTEETAKILGIPTGTVLSRLSRAQKKLKEYLVPYVEEKV